MPCFPLPDRDCFFAKWDDILFSEKLFFTFEMYISKSLMCNVQRHELVNNVGIAQAGNYTLLFLREMQGFTYCTQYGQC